MHAKPPLARRFIRRAPVTAFRVGLVAAALLLLGGLGPATARADAIYTFGFNGFGQLGIGDTAFHTAPVALTGPLSSGVTAVATGTYHSLAIQNGGIYAWGYNANGQLGLGDTTDRSTPVALSGPLGSGVTAITAGQYHSLAIQNGGVYAWGANPNGQLGTGDVTAHASPVALTGPLASGVSAIAAGDFHSLAVRNGGVYAWGANFSGQLGDGTTTQRNSPVALTGPLASGVTAIAAGDSHGLALRNGGVYAWGYNSNGQLGDGTTIQRNTPFALTGPLATGVTAIAAGQYHSVALRNGGVWAWGDNTFGQLGDGSTVQQNTPEQIDPADLFNIVAVAAGDGSTYALSSDGSLWNWGDNIFFELGLNSQPEYHTPQHLLPPTGYAFTSIDADANGDHVLVTVAIAPEPASLSLCALAAGSLLARRRKR